MFPRVVWPESGPPGHPAAFPYDAGRRKTHGGLAWGATAGPESFTSCPSHPSIGTHMLILSLSINTHSA